MADNASKPIPIPGAPSTRHPTPDRTRLERMDVRVWFRVTKSLRREFDELLALERAEDPTISIAALVRKCMIIGMRARRLSLARFGKF